MTKIFVIDQHDQLLDIWRELNMRGIQLDHLDFHCDMRGLYVDRGACRAAWVGKEPYGVDEGNFISHAVMENRVDDVVWAHSDPGGRIYDTSGVIFENDVSYLIPWKRVRKDTFRGSFGCKVLDLSDWLGPNSKRWLDIDWDVFASIEIPRDSLEQRASLFLDSIKGKPKDAPQFISICYSPEYSHPTRGLFDQFVADIAELYDAKVDSRPCLVDRVAQEVGIRKHIPTDFLKMKDMASTRVKQFLRRRGIFF